MLEKVDMKRGVLQNLFTVAARGIDKVGGPTSTSAEAEADEEGEAEEEEEGEDPI
jgi:hypothetical protein